MRTGVFVTKINGNVFLTENEEVKEIGKEKKLGVKKKYIVNTDKNSYCIISHNTTPESKKQGYYAVLYPESSVSVLTGRGDIKEIEVLKGIFYTPGIPKVKILFAEFIDYPLAVSCFIEVFADKKVVLFDGRVVVKNKKTGKLVELEGNCEITVTENDISDNIPMQQKYYEIKKTFNEIYAFGGEIFYEELHDKTDKLKEAALYVNKILAEKTGEDFEKTKKEIEEQFEKQKIWAYQQREEMKKIKEKILKRDYNKKSEVVTIDKTAKYNELIIKILNIRVEEKDENKKFLSIYFEVENNTNKEIFIFWNEEARLINQEGEVIEIEDYNLETDFIPGSKKSGYLFAKNMKKDDIISKIQFGKKSLSKTEISLTESGRKKMPGYKHPCNYCGKLIENDSKYCPYCAKVNPLGPLRCPKCRNPITREHKVCGNCGLNLTITCPKCKKQTFFGDYCDNCNERLIVVCKNPKCKEEQPPLQNKCIKCGKPL